MKWCRMLESNQHLAIIDRGLDLRANPARSTPSLSSVAQGKALVRRSGVEPASVGCRPTTLVR